MKNTYLIFNAAKKIDADEFKSLDKLDIRNDYLNRQKGLHLSYCKGYMLLDFFEVANIDKLEFEGYEKWLINHTLKDVDSTIKYLSHFHRSFIINSWSLFELFINAICPFVLNESEIDNLLTYEFNQLKKYIGQDDNEKVITLLRKKHVSHVPIVRKYEKILKKYSMKYNRNRIKDTEFLKFFGDLRNSMHSNFIYYGNDKTFVFQDIEFKFINNSLVVYSDPELVSPILYLSLVRELMDISIEISKAIEFPGCIPYPDTNAQ